MTTQLHLQTLSPEATWFLVQELQAHQIELEAQNDELTRAYEQMAAERTFYAEHYDHSPVGYCSVNEQGQIVNANLSAAALFGVKRSFLLQTNITEFVVREDQDRLYLLLQEIARTTESQTCDFQCRSGDGEAHWIAVTATPERSKLENRVIHLKIRDIDELKRAQTELEQSEFRWKSAIEASGDGVWDWNIQTDDFQYSRRWKDLLGYGAGDVLVTMNHWKFRTHPEDEKRVVAAVQDCLFGITERLSADYRLRCKDGSYKWVTFRGMVVHRSEDGDPIRMIGTLIDISERKINEERLKLAASVFSNAVEGILITSSDGTIIEANESFTRITGYSRDEVIGKNPSLLSSSRHQTEFFEGMWRALGETVFWRGEIWNRRKNGEVYTEMQTINAVRNLAGEVQYYIALYSDISQLKERECELEQIAHYDALTGLPNRVLCADRLRQAMAMASRHQRRLAVAFFDLDGFKAINDQNGHEIGDLVLIALANRLKLVLRDGDTMSRLGGDEFVLVLPELMDPAAVDAMLSRIVYDAAKPLELGEFPIQVTVSLGVTFYPQEREVDANELIRQADHAMYQAKRSGKNCYHLFSNE